MSSRLLIGLGALLLLLGGTAVLLQLFPSGREAQTAVASVLIQANNGGVLLAPEDARVYVHVSGSTESLIAEGALEQPFSLPPGEYDVRVLFSRSRDQQSQWLRGIELVGGEQVSRRVEFSAGEISVEATVGTIESEPGQVVVYVFVPDEHDVVITSMGAGEPALLAAGAYDLRVVWTVNSQEKAVRWYRDVKVNVGLQTKVNVLFDRGMLAVLADNAGKPLSPGSVTLTVYRAGDLQREVLDSGLAGVPLGLASGLYDVKATYTSSSDKPSRWLHAVEIRDGESAEQSIAFSSGSVVVDAQVKGGGALDAFDAYIYYYRAGDHQQPVAYTPAGDTAILEGGRYDVRALFFRSHDQPDIWIRDLEIETGETSSRTVAFPSGKLLVRAYDETGVELIGDNVFIYVYATGERSKPVAVARSGELLTLTEGDYDIRAEDTRRENEVRWLERIHLRSGLISEQSVTF